MATATVGTLDGRHTRSFLPAIAIAIAIVVLACAQLACPRQAGTERPDTSSGMTKSISALRDAYAAFNRDDFDATVAALDPAIQWTEPATFPGGGTYHGRESVKAYLRQSRSHWAQGSSKPVRFIVANNRIVVFVFVRFQPKGSGEWHEAKIADVYTVRHGKIVQMNAFADREQALRWASSKTP